MSAPAPLSTSLPSLNTSPLRFIKITLFRFSFSGICCFLFFVSDGLGFFFFFWVQVLELAGNAVWDNKNRIIPRHI